MLSLLICDLKFIFKQTKQKTIQTNVVLFETEEYSFCLVLTWLNSHMDTKLGKRFRAIDFRNMSFNHAVQSRHLWQVSVTQKNRKMTMSELNTNL